MLELLEAHEIAIDWKDTFRPNTLLEKLQREPWSHVHKAATPDQTSICIVYTMATCTFIKLKLQQGVALSLILASQLIWSIQSHVLEGVFPAKLTFCNCPRGPVAQPVVSPLGS